jgi:hypothetical protein
MDRQQEIVSSLSQPMQSRADGKYTLKAYPPIRPPQQQIRRHIRRDPSAVFWLPEKTGSPLPTTAMNLPHRPGHEYRSGSRIVFRLSGTGTGTEDATLGVFPGTTLSRALTGGSERWDISM